jgi:hypothetical protein
MSQMVLSILLAWFAWFSCNRGLGQDPENRLLKYNLENGVICPRGYTDPVFSNSPKFETFDAANKYIESREIKDGKFYGRVGDDVEVDFSENIRPDSYKFWGMMTFISLFMLTVVCSPFRWLVWGVIAITLIDSLKK